MAAAVAVVLLGLGLLALANRILLRMALRNIPRRRAQTVLILFGLMLATLIITASLAVGDTSAYSIQELQLKQVGGIDEAITRLSNNSIVQGAGTSDADFFSGDQATAAMAAAKSDRNVAATAGAIVAPGSMLDVTMGETSSLNVAIFGVGSDFSSVWGPVRSNSVATLDVARLGVKDVFLGKSVANRLNASSGDRLHLYVDGHLIDETVRGVLDTEVNPSIANHGPVVNSVLLPIEVMRAVLQRPTGFNLIYVDNYGAGGVDDLGAAGATGDEVTRHMRAAFTDQQSATELKDYLSTAAIKTQIQKIHDQASFL